MSAMSVSQESDGSLTEMDFGNFFVPDLLNTSENCMNDDSFDEILSGNVEIVASDNVDGETQKMLRALQIFTNDEEILSPEMPSSAKSTSTFLTSFTQTNGDEKSVKRFKSISDKEMKEIESSAQSKNTQKNTAWGVRIFQGKSNRQGEDDLQEEGENQTKENDKELENLKQKLEQHFRHDFAKVCGRPIWKRLPLKFVLAGLKIIFITIQLIRFGEDQKEFENFLDKNNIALKNMLLKNWKPLYETMPYPPSTGKYAVYDINDLNKHIEHAINQIYSLPTISVGSFFIRNENEAVQVCVDYYPKRIYNQTNKRLQMDLAFKEDCNYIGKNFAPEFGLNVTIEELMSRDNLRLLAARVKFLVESIYVRKKDGVECFSIDGEILFDNREINEQVIVTLTTNIAEFECQKLVWRTKTIKLSRNGFWQILRIRDLITILSDSCSLIGTIIKIFLDNQDSLHSTTRHNLYETCGILLSIGCLLVWIGILHYFNFFQSFYLMFAIIENSALSVFKFLLCVVMIYFGFALCGWIVLGPYHLKFATLGSTIQTLLALLNGDEIFVTFRAIDENKTTALVFNNIFIVLFIFVFTIIVVNILLAIVDTIYEEIQKYQRLDKKIKEKEGESEDPFDGLSEIQKLLKRYRLPRRV